MSEEVIRYPSPQEPTKFSPPVRPEQPGLTISSSMPAFARINDITARFGLPRTRVYELLATGALEARKDGKALLVNVASVARFINMLPKANIRLPKTLARQAAAKDAPTE
jgi:hypothetical protein